MFLRFLILVKSGMAKVELVVAHLLCIGLFFRGSKGFTGLSAHEVDEKRAKGRDATLIYGNIVQPKHLFTE